MTTTPVSSVTTVPRLAAALLATALSVGLTTLPTAAAPESPPGPPPGLPPGAAPVVNHLRPVPGTVLVPADIPDQNWLPGHRGVDLDAASGAAVRASAAGTVRFAGVVAGTPTVSVDHGGGLRTTYEPVLAQVRAGEQVSRGQILGELADHASLPGTARRDPGLHWGAVLGPPAEDAERYIDPMTLLGPVQVRLWR
ncbi:murein hydrolase activator EnvC family protein [Corynebacterium variabile]|uniref:murein hydrolase activator EnvC family protein n=1 Tax=Corynebacterium variabile TaxID=1727 RepID=UPI003735026F